MRYELTDLADMLRAARETNGLSQQALGQLVGVPQSHISKIESGQVDLRVTSLIEIARALDMELTLVPRRSLPVVKNIARGAVRGPTEVKGSPTTHQKALKRIESTIASLIKKHPANEQLAQLQRQAKELQRFQVPDSYLQTIRAAEKCLKSMDPESNDLRVIGETLSEFRKLRNTLAHAASEPPGSDVPRPAYRLEDDDG